MALNFITNLQVPILPENEVWFLNSAAWTNYWASINIQGSFDAYGNVAYAESIYDNSLMGYNLNYGEVAYAFPSQAQFNSLLAAYQTLNINYKNLRADLVAIGLLENL
jgi:hypothetical protein